MRKQAVLIIWFAMPDQAPGEVKKGRETETLDFLITRTHDSRSRPGFVTININPNESPLDAIRRQLPYSESAITSPPHELTQFSFTARGRETEVFVLELGVGQAERYADLHEQAVDTREKKPVTTWEEIGWLFYQDQENLVNELTHRTLAEPAVRDFLESARERPRQAA